MTPNSQTPKLAQPITLYVDGSDTSRQIENELLDAGIETEYLKLKTGPVPCEAGFSMRKPTAVFDGRKYEGPAEIRGFIHMRVPASAGDPSLRSG